jgi:hypothetical protein
MTVMTAINNAPSKRDIIGKAIFWVVAVVIPYLWAFGIPVTDVARAGFVIAVVALVLCRSGLKTQLWPLMAVHL